MVIGVVSDTHGHVHHTQSAVRMLESFNVQQVLHCGDIGSAEIPPLFAQWPTHYVLGNVDEEEFELRRVIEKCGGQFHGRFADLEIAGVRIALIHSDDARRFRDCISSGKWQLVCYGHTHRAEHHEVGGTLVLNPGAIYRANPRSLALVELPKLHVEQINI